MEFKRHYVNRARYRVEWLGRESRGSTLWCADGDGFVFVISNKYRNILFDQGEFIARLPRDLDEALADATMWLANDYPTIYRNIREEINL